ncbi:hypothetical protein WDV76_18605 [Xenorhabdus griffiniae]|uniref:hypothetical protein n=1 Tax=Xenorhabdus griffiniae TaxID=351672 RepID=UPI002358E099|nr:hypothetical protein [Xenorhabdus griffiniae]MDC9606677.1 hypothetical protein [Xenorhabdus griffiniae]
MHHYIGICVVAQSQIVSQGVKEAINKLELSIGTESGDCGVWEPNSAVSVDFIMTYLLQQAREYLLAYQKKHQFSFHVMTYETLDEALADMALHPDRTLDLVIADDLFLQHGDYEQVCHQFFQLFESNSGKFSPYSCLFSLSEMTQDSAQVQMMDSVTCNIRQSDPLVWEIQVLKNLMDHLDNVYINPLLVRATTSKLMTSSMAQFIYDYMEYHFQERWDFHYYTGSMISGFIDSMLRLCDNTSTLCESGPNEHSLAVSALCGWQFYQHGYVIAATSGMIDEFRGTLYNLKRAHAPGIIICADSPGNSWYPFQGTMHQDYDGRKSIEAKGIPCVYIDDRATLPERLSEIGALLQSQPGPVFILATQSVLECTLKSEQLPHPNQWSLLPPLIEDSETSVIDAVMFLINHDKRRILWQCCHLAVQERELIYQIAEKAGIVLADAMISPGGISDYHQQKLVSNYIGTLSNYGFSRRIFRYLHEGQELAAPESQSIFFLKSKVDEASSPLSPSKLKNKCHIVQVNCRSEHMSPYTDLAVHSDLLPFLKTVLARLNVDEEVLAYRRHELARVQNCPDTTPIDWLPQMPMSPNYFYAHLGKQLHNLISKQGFVYTGVYDVGRCGVSAIRNLPKTGKGFSGWYGRALMGDALMSLPYLARTSSQNILAFIGDGARDLTPNIEHHIERALMQNPHRQKINISVFYLCNGMLSMIRSYIDKRSATNEIKQSSLVTSSRYLALVTTSNIQISSEPHGTIQVIRERWATFDAAYCETVLTTPQTIYFIDVMLSHNSDGDGLSLLSEAAWQCVNIV